MKLPDPSSNEKAVEGVGDAEGVEDEVEAPEEVHVEERVEEVAEAAARHLPAPVLLRNPTPAARHPAARE